MPYSTITEVERAVGGPDKLLQLTDTTGDGVADDVVDLAISEADELISSYAGKRWAPSSTPLVIRNLSAKMAARFLRRDRGVPRPTDETDEVNDRKWLEALAAGVVTLPAGTANAELVVDKAEVRDSARDVSRSKFKGFS